MMDRQRYSVGVLTRKRGFSLIEIIVAILLLAVLLGLTGMTLTKSIDQEGPRALSLTLASDLRAARAEAQRSGKMVAVCFPSEGKTNSICRSAQLRKGSQRGHRGRKFIYGNEYDASIFLGTWPGAVLNTTQIPISWAVSTSDEVAIHFRPDGSAFSNDIPAIDGNYPLVVGASFQGDLSGPGGTLTHAKNPHTVWVSGTGAVDIEERTVPGPQLPVGESNLSVAELKATEPPEGSPTVAAVRFFPSQIQGFQTSYIGQNFVSIHPNQKEGSFLEYGTASVEILAEDSDGGPLRYSLEAIASNGEEGRFAVSNLEGQLRYVEVDDVDLDEDGNPDPPKDFWRAVISWRPPAGADPRNEYELIVTVLDPDDNSVEISSSAGLLPKVTSLPPSRMVVCSDTQDLYITNLDGANEVHITKDGPEVEPFFSADGSRIFSFHDAAGSIRSLRSRPVDGSVAFDTLASFDISAGNNILFDPTFTYAALMIPGVQEFPWGQWTQETDYDFNGNPVTRWVFNTGISRPAVQHISIINLMSNDPPMPLGSAIPDTFSWGTSQNRHAFSYGLYTSSDMTTEREETFHEHPGHRDSSSQKKITGYPSTLSDVPGIIGSSSGRIYNPANPVWYLRVDGNELWLGNEGVASFTEISLATSTSGFQNDTKLNFTPTWSADGERIVYVKSPGSGSILEVQHVLDGNHTWGGSATVEYTRTAPGLGAARLSPEGEWVYFMQGGDIFRADNLASGSEPPVDISSHLGVKIVGYVISP